MDELSLGTVCVRRLHFHLLRRCHPEVLEPPAKKIALLHKH